MIGACDIASGASISRNTLDWSANFRITFIYDKSLWTFEEYSSFEYMAATLAQRILWL